MSDDYISREAAIKALSHGDGCGHVCRHSIERIPASDVTPVRHGRWINGRCSECGEHAPFWSMASTYYLSKYCHGCGAKMDLPEPPKDKAPADPYDLLYEEGGPDA